MAKKNDHVPTAAQDQTSVQGAFPAEVPILYESDAYGDPEPDAAASTTIMKPVGTGGPVPIVAPKGMPDEAKATLEKVMKEVVESEDFKKEAIRIKTAAHWMSGKEFRERYYEELAQYKKILEENGLIAK